MNGKILVVARTHERALQFGESLGLGRTEFHPVSTYYPVRGTRSTIVLVDEFPPGEQGEMLRHALIPIMENVFVRWEPPAFDWAERDPAEPPLIGALA